LGIQGNDHSQRHGKKDGGKAVHGRKWYRRHRAVAIPKHSPTLRLP
jgi:hypothetical protein